MQRNLTEQPLVLFADDRQEVEMKTSATFYQVSLANNNLTIKYVCISPFSEQVVNKKNLRDKHGLLEELQKYTSLAQITEKKRAELTKFLQDDHQTQISIAACANVVVRTFKEFYDLNQATEAIILQTASACISGVAKSNDELNGKIHNSVAEHFIVYLKRYLAATATSRNLADILDFYISTTTGSVEISPPLPKKNATSESVSSTINNINPVTSYIPAAAIDITTSAPATPRRAMTKVNADSQTSTATIAGVAGITSSPSTNVETIPVDKIKRNAASQFSDMVMDLVNNPMLLTIARREKNIIFESDDAITLGALADVLERILLPAIITASKVTCDESIWNIDCMNHLDPNMEIKRSTKNMQSNVFVQMLNVLEINFLLKLQYKLHVKPSDTAHVNFNIQTSNPRFALQFFHKSELPASQPKSHSSLRMSG